MKQKKKCAELKNMDLANGRAYHMKLSLHEMFRRSPIISEMYFDEWYG
ncbi:hypothetical protein [Oceanobacillus profundus]|nr:hypothetical protein [Oceanobacillus profundus]